MTCDVCGGRLNPNNTTGVCRRTPECARERDRRRRPAARAKLLCELCGQETSGSIAICRSNDTCRKAYQNEYYRIRWTKLNPRPSCELCGRTLRKDNLVGVCQTNKVCQLENKLRYYAISDKTARRRASLKWKKNNPEAAKAVGRAWHAEHPESRLQAAHRRRARINGVPSEDYTRQQVTEAYGYWCYLCCKPIISKSWHLDHVFPISRGGWDVLMNVRPTHGMCNQRKHAKIIPLVAWVILSAYSTEASKADRSWVDPLA